MNINDVMGMIAVIAEHQDELAAQGVAVAIAALNPETQIECMFAVGDIGDVTILTADLLNSAIRNAVGNDHAAESTYFDIATKIINGNSKANRH